MQIPSESRASQPLVTVIVASYNHEPYVSQAIESVGAQTYPNIEIIVIDDGSRDRSIQIINGLTEKHRLIVIARENRGLARTLNEGLALARGRYISLLASDDYYFPHRIEKAVQLLERSSDQVACVYCDGYIVDKAGRKLGCFGDRHPRPLFGSVYDNLVVGNWIPGTGVTFKAKLLKQLGFDERFMIEDHTLFLRMFKDGRLFLKYYDDIGFGYRWHGGNLSNPGSAMERENRLIEQCFEDVGKYAEFKRCLKGQPIGLANAISPRNCYLLTLHLARWLRKKPV